MREIVIVIADLYLNAGADAAASEAARGVAAIPGIQALGRFGARAPLPHGWRDWLARSVVGRADLAGVAPACVAAAALAAAESEGAEEATRWIATPVQLVAGLARVHLDPRGLQRLPAEQLAVLAAEFHRTFGASGLSLAPLPSGDFLLRTPGIAPADTVEPARCVGGDVGAALPRGPATASLRRLMAEIEMWLHALPLNEARQLRGEPPVTALWPWGAAGRIVRPEPRARRAGQLAFGRDAWLEGLWRLQGSTCGVLPAQVAEVLATPDAQRIVLVLEAGGELQQGNHATLAEALARLDVRFMQPALAALRRGGLTAVTLIVNDTLATARRGSLLKFWRRPRAGLGSFA